MTITGIITAILIGIVVGVLGRLAGARQAAHRHARHDPGRHRVGAFIGTAIARALGIPTATNGIDWLELLVQVIVAALGVALVSTMMGRRRRTGVVGRTQAFQACSADLTATHTNPVGSPHRPPGSSRCSAATPSGSAAISAAQSSLS